MASILKRSDWFYCRFSDREGNRPSIALNTKSQRKATQAKVRIEELVSASKTGQDIDAETKLWVSKQKPGMRDKLARYGLIEFSGPARAGKVTLGQHIDDYFARRSDVKTATQVSWSQSRRNLIVFFGVDKPLASITAGDAKDYEIYLKNGSQKKTPTSGPTKPKDSAQTRYGHASAMPSSFSVMPWNMKSLAATRLPN